ncbi:MAG: cytochrome b N-terminal domain-containing protein [Thermodesulfobacterium sp.]|nr:cytochrome b N-terminal domain-containing protein [Thermodesulfobacterium sp.]
MPYLPNLPKKLYPEVAYFSASSFLVCILSGMVLSFHYFPEKALQSLVTLEATVPFGRFFRSLHYFSAQIALISLFLHLLDSLRLRVYLLKNGTSWFFLGLSLFVMLYLCFTGYLLRGDEVGELASAIADSLTKSFPILGLALNKLFFAIPETGLHRVYLWHIFLSFLTACGIFIFHVPFKRLVRFPQASYALFSVVLAFIFYPPLKPFGEVEARGPWFFVGAQSMLKVFPQELVFLYLLFFPFLYQAFSSFRRYEKLILAIFISYLLIYFVFSFLWFALP